MVKFCNAHARPKLFTSKHAACASKQKGCAASESTGRMHLNSPFSSDPLRGQESQDHLPGDDQQRDNPKQAAEQGVCMSFLAWCLQSARCCSRSADGHIDAADTGGKGHAPGSAGGHCRGSPEAAPGCARQHSGRALHIHPEAARAAAGETARPYPDPCLST